MTMMFSHPPLRPPTFVVGQSLLDRDGSAGVSGKATKTSRGKRMETARGYASRAGGGSRMRMPSPRAAKKRGGRLTTTATTNGVRVMLLAGPVAIKVATHDTKNTFKTMQRE